MSFIDQINNVFGDYIKDGMIRCSQEDFRDGLNTIIESSSVHKERKKREPSNFMKWLNQNRDSIKEEYFADFEEYADWSEEGIRTYYSSKELPLEKLNILIDKKKQMGKSIGKPRLVSLITTKAGLLWKDMSEDEKTKYNSVVIERVEKSEKSEKSENSENSESLVTKSLKKKGRPKGRQPQNSVSDMAVLNSIQN